MFALTNDHLQTASKAITVTLEHLSEVSGHTRNTCHTIIIIKCQEGGGLQNLPPAFTSLQFVWFVFDVQMYLLLMSPVLFLFFFFTLRLILGVNSIL